MTTSALALASLLLSSIPGLPRAPLAGAAADCALTSSLGDALPTRACLECHRGHAGRSHAVDVDYAAAALRPNGDLRPPAEVVRRGLLLPGGRLECVTCHDGRSQWAAKIALPPGAPVLPAVITGRRGTYEGRASWRIVKASALPALPPGSAVSPAPLCAACHSLAD